MTGWPRIPIRPKPKSEQARTQISGGASQTNLHHRPGTVIELSECLPSPSPSQGSSPGQSQSQAGRTPTSSRIPPGAPPSPTNPANPSHRKRLQTWWSRTIRPDIEHGAPGLGDPRDYLALERTFLGWFRTSVALVSFGVILTQLFVLKDVDPAKGKILGALVSGGGISVVLLGCIRYFRQQRLLTQGSALSGGWHHQILILMLLVILMALFVIVILDG